MRKIGTITKTQTQIAVCEKIRWSGPSSLLYPQSGQGVKENNLRTYCKPHKKWKLREQKVVNKRRHMTDVSSCFAYLLICFWKRFFRTLGMVQFFFALSFDRFASRNTKRRRIRVLESSGQWWFARFCCSQTAMWTWRRADRIPRQTAGL
jgi:hypothetical protein